MKVQMFNFWGTESTLCSIKSEFFIVLKGAALQHTIYNQSWEAKWNRFSFHYFLF